MRRISSPVQTSSCPERRDVTGGPCQSPVPPRCPETSSRRRPHRVSVVQPSCSRQSKPPPFLISGEQHCRTCVLVGPSCLHLMMSVLRRFRSPTGASPPPPELAAPIPLRASEPSNAAIPKRSCCQHFPMDFFRIRVMFY
jgi:hypothetical protein